MIADFGLRYADFSEGCSVGCTSDALCGAVTTSGSDRAVLLLCSGDEEVVSGRCRRTSNPQSAIRDPQFI